MEGVSNVSDVKGNTKPSRNRCRRWCFTVNNYNEELYVSLLKTFSTMGAKCIIGKEKGFSGTIHLQGYVEFKNQIEFDTIKNICVTAHWEKAKGNKIHNIKYCSKEKNFISNFEEPRNLKKELLEKYYSNPTVLYEWQSMMLKIIEDERESRKINWFYEDTGCEGKTWIAKYIMLKYDDVILGEGKAIDVKYIIKEWMKDHPCESPRAIIIDIPRSFDEEYVNYGLLEKLKDGMTNSGKYESGTLLFDHPHIIITSNYPPNMEMMSKDRWNVHCFNKDSATALQESLPRPYTGLKNLKKTKSFFDD